MSVVEQVQVGLDLKFVFSSFSIGYLFLFVLILEFDIFILFILSFGLDMCTSFLFLFGFNICSLKIKCISTSQLVCVFR